jgi:hypothetical protein
MKHAAASKWATEMIQCLSQAPYVVLILDVVKAACRLYLGKQPKEGSHLETRARRTSRRKRQLATFHCTMRHRHDEQIFKALVHTTMHSIYGRLSNSCCAQLSNPCICQTLPLCRPDALIQSLEFQLFNIRLPFSSSR